MTDINASIGPNSNRNAMGSPSTFRAGRPVSVLLAVILLAVAYWLGILPNESTDRSVSDSTAPATTVEAPSRSDAPRLPQGQATTENSIGKSQSSELLHGMLREVARREYLSPAGLLYTPGSAEGHRLAHLERHTQDDPRRSGSHGVFDGGMEGALKTIDLAYERAKTGQRTTTESDDGRTIYTVDLGKRVGYVGGSQGQRRGHPMARRVRLVLEGNRVVTAFPL